MADYQYIKETGLIVPDTQAILTEVENEFKALFGQDLDVSPSTPQGMWIAAEAEARSRVVRNNAAMANQINPNEAGGVCLDAVLGLTGIERNAQTYSYVTLDLTGVPGTVVPADTLVNSGGLTVNFSTNSSVTLDLTGQAQVVASAVTAGPIAAPANTLTFIVSGPLGLETVNNPDAAVLGSLTQSDASARTYRRSTLAFQASRLSEAITSGLYATSGVTSVKFLENDYNISRDVEGVTLVPHSLYVCVAGGTDLAVAETILDRKSGGCNYNNGFGIPVEVTFIDEWSGQPYTIKFDRPTLIPVQTKVYVKVGNSVQNPSEAVKQAILNYANGLLPGEEGFKIGAAVSAFELSGAVNVQSPGIFVNKVEIKKIADVDWGIDTIPIAVYEQAQISSSAIQVIIL